MIGVLQQEYVRTAPAKGLAVAMKSDAERKPLMTELQKQTVERGVAFPLSQNPRAAALSGKVRATRQPIFAPDDIAPRPEYLWAR
jgi:peptide/nickel transport system substrate-binding protein